MLALIPIGTNAPVYRAPWVTYGLMLAIVVMSLGAMSNPALMESLALQNPSLPHQYLTYSLVNSNFFSLLGSLYAIWLFGCAVEYKYGWWKYLPLYFVTAAGGAAAYGMLVPGATEPLATSMGAALGLLGAYIMIYPTSDVKCIFWFIFIFRVTPVAALFFVPCVAVILIIVQVVAFGYYTTNLGFWDSPLSLYLGGMFAGIGVTAALYGFKGFSDESARDASAERELKKKLHHDQIREHLGSDFLPPSAIDSQFKPLTDAMHEVQRHMILGAVGKTCDLYEAALVDDPAACLHPGPQMELARMMKKNGESAAARHALENLLRVYPKEPAAQIAKFELAEVLIEQGGAPVTARELLEEFLGEDPPYDLERDAKRMIRDLGGDPDETPGEQEEEEVLQTQEFGVFQAHYPDEVSVATESENASSSSHKEALMTTGNTTADDSDLQDLFAEVPRAEADSYAALERTPVVKDDTGNMLERARDLFGDPDASDAFEVIQPKISEPPIGAPVPKSKSKSNPNMESKAGAHGKGKSTPKDSHAESSAGQPIKFDTTGGGAKPGGNSQPPDNQEPYFELDRSAIKDAWADADPAIIDDEPVFDEPVHIEMDDASGFVIEKSRGGDSQTDNSHNAPRPAPLAQRPGRPAEAAKGPAKQAKSSEAAGAEKKAPNEQAEIEIHDLTFDPNDQFKPEEYVQPTPEQQSDPRRMAQSAKEFSEEIHSTQANLERSNSIMPKRKFEYSPTGRYSVILAPGKPAEISLVVSLIAPVLKMNPDSAHHAVLRRRGILLSGLIAHDAQKIAERMAKFGQSVAVVQENNLMEFGEPEDVLSLKEQLGSGRFATTTEILPCAWDHAVLAGAGAVILGPGAPIRTVFDIFFTRPGRQIRFWENTFNVPWEPIGSQSVEFWKMAKHMAERVPGAIQTRSLDDWIKKELDYPPVTFHSLIEYQNYLQWHILAYHAPKMVYDGTK